MAKKNTSTDNTAGKVSVIPTKENKHHKTGAPIPVTPEIAKILIDKGYATKAS